MTATENRGAVEGTLDSLAEGDQSESADNPYRTGAVSEDGTVAYSTVTYTAGAVDLYRADEERHRARREPGP